ncbi:virus entry/fusion complex component [Pteropox virus]|uniref:Virus entry/fusion complex component n=1 Tax=Pteropox virus TaxID=1873698 RepID=A0A1B1MRB2_9POXV|nr:virus entry/fusion complex component [Pteropox virus]ANS71131.1 virus entry/fusion complex component [Pteropox virus]
MLLIVIFLLAFVFCSWLSISYLMPYLAILPETAFKPKKTNKVLMKR